MKPLILITNDDGIGAEGLVCLYNALKDWAEVVVVAPSTEQSAVGLSITVRNPLKIQPVKWPGDKAYAVTGTPADSVKMALSVILKRKPDLIVSGVNKGSNAGRNVLYSGTVSAVIEGAHRNIPGVAFSCYDYYDPHYAGAEKFIKPIVEYALTHKLPDATLLNVNFPSRETGEILGIKMARQGKEYWIEDPIERSYENQSYWWLGTKKALHEEHLESDIAYLSKGYIACVPVFVGDMTHSDHLEQHKGRFESFFASER
jgi:5'-nucleotidase